VTILWSGSSRSAVHLFTFTVAHWNFSLQSFSVSTAPTTVPYSFLEFLHTYHGFVWSPRLHRFLYLEYISAFYLEACLPPLPTAHFYHWSLEFYWVISITFYWNFTAFWKASVHFLPFILLPGVPHTCSGVHFLLHSVLECHFLNFTYYLHHSSWATVPTIFLYHACTVLFLEVVSAWSYRIFCSSCVHLRSLVFSGVHSASGYAFTAPFCSCTFSTTTTGLGTAISTTCSTFHWCTVRSTCSFHKFSSYLAGPRVSLPICTFWVFYLGFCLGADFIPGRSPDYHFCLQMLGL